MARRHECNYYRRKIKDALKQKNISSAKANLDNFKNCPNYEQARVAVAKMEDALAHTTVPNVIGLRGNGAKVIRAADLIVDIKRGSHTKDCGKDGMVERQNPLAGARVKKRSTITVWVKWTGGTCF